MERRRSTTGFWIALAVLGVLLVFSVVLNFAMLIGMAAGRGTPMSAREHGFDEVPRVQQRWSYGQGDVKVVRIPVSGIITREAQGGFLAPPVDKIERIIGHIRAATEDEDVRGLILEVDSPGGAISPSDELHHAVRTFRESREDRRVVMFTRDMAASGGYYVGVAADWLIAEPTAIVGSIGVLMSTLNWHELSRDIGVRDTTIKSGQNKDLLNPFREVDPDQVALLQDVVDTMHERFRGIVHSRRNIPGAALDTLADGRIFSAEEALEQDLIDEIGYWDEAVSRMAALLGEEDVKVIRYGTEPRLLDLLSGMDTPAGAVRDLMSDLQTPRFLYLWRP